jgi:hypothetical protein
LLTPSAIFAVAHTLNAGLNIVYALVQTLVFARTLDTDLFARVILLVMVGLYLSPLNQAVARANFGTIRERVVHGGGLRGMDGAAAAFHFDQFAMVAASMIVPLFISRSPGEYAAFAAFGLFVNLSNMWVLEIQTSLIAAERTVIFEFATLARRLLNAATLAHLWFTRDFLLFSLLLAAQTILFHLAVIMIVNRTTDLFRWPHGLTLEGARAQGRSILLAAQATVGEWTTLNLPYLLFSLRFGVGPALITIDTALKLVRIVLSVARILSEVVLAQISRAMMTGEQARARHLTSLALLLTALAALPMTALLAWKGELIFALLLGPNNVVPSGAGLPVALAVMVAAGFQVGSFFVSHLGQKQEIRLFTITSIGLSLLYGAWVMLAEPTLLAALWGLAISFTLITVGCLIALARMFRSAPAAAEPQAA